MFKRSESVSILANGLLIYGIKNKQYKKTMENASLNAFRNDDSVFFFLASVGWAMVPPIAHTHIDT